MMTIRALIAILVFYLGLLLVLRNHRDSTYVFLAKIGFFLHVLVAIVVLPFLFGIEGSYNWDVGSYDRAAMDIYGGEVSAGSTAIASFAIIMAILYTIFTPDLLIPSVFNAFVAVLIPIPAAVVAKQLYPGLRSTTLLKAIILFLPLPTLFLTIPMRDTVAVFLFFSALALFSKGLREDEYRLILAGLPVTALLAIPRDELAAVTMIGLTIGIAVKYFVKPKRLHANLAGYTIGIGVAGAIGAFVFTEFFYDIERAASRMEGRARDGAAYLEHLQIESITDFVLAMPIRALYFQFMPFPLYVRNFIDILVIASLPIMIVLAVAGIRSLLSGEAEIPIALLILATYVLGIVGYGMINSNFGTTVRHRISFVFLLGVFAAPVLSQWELVLRRQSRVWIDNDNYCETQHRETQKPNCDCEIRE